MQFHWPIRANDPEINLNGGTDYGWYLCLDVERIVAGMGVIENDFHDRKDLTPNVCAVYTEEDYRCRGIAGRRRARTIQNVYTSLNPDYSYYARSPFVEFDRVNIDFFNFTRSVPLGLDRVNIHFP